MGGCRYLKVDANGIGHNQCNQLHFVSTVSYEHSTAITALLADKTSVNWFGIPFQIFDLLLILNILNSRWQNDLKVPLISFFRYLSSAVHRHLNIVRECVGDFSDMLIIY